MRHHDLAFIDLETTGLSNTADDIIELAVVLVDGGDLSITAQHETLVRPRGRNGAAHVNRISERMLADAPSFASVAPALRHMFAGRQVVGHNIKSFDFHFLNNALRRTGHPELERNAIIDTLHLARRYVPARDAKLTTLAAHFGLTYPDAHTALADTLMTVEIFRHIVAAGYTPAFAATVCGFSPFHAPDAWYPRAAARDMGSGELPF